MDELLVIEAPKAKRIRKALVTLAITVGVSAWAVGYIYSQDQLGIETLGLLPFFFLGVFQTYRYWHTSELTPEAKQQKQAQEEAERRKQAEKEDKWYFRYPLAGLCCWTAWHVAETKPDEWWWLAVIAVLAAAVFAREASLLLLGFGLIYFAFQGIASLPVSAAVIIGAIIIASALRK